MKCPYCAEEIQDEAKKCKHCGEWLDASCKPGTNSKPEEQENKIVVVKETEEPKEELYECYLVNEDGQWVKTENYKGKNEEELAKLISEKYGTKFALHPEKKPSKIDVKTSSSEWERVGKYSCPRCGSRNTTCERQIGCAILIIIFVSCGLGLIMIPFLPYHCECWACGNKWKT